MPRYGRKRYTHSTRSRSRFSRTLSHRRIFGNRSARAQASQIAALNRRISKVAKISKPEKKVFIDGFPTVTLDSGAVGSIYTAFGDTNIQRGPNNSDRVGDKIRACTRYRLSFEYYNNSATGYHDSESSGVQVRIIMGRLKYPNVNSSYPAPSSLVHSYGASGDNYDHVPISPLISGVTEKNYIDYDKTFYLTTDRNQKTLTLRSPLYTRRFDDAVNVDWSNHTWMVIIAGGLHYDNDFKEYVKVTASRKTVFTDV